MASTCGGLEDADIYGTRSRQGRIDSHFLVALQYCMYRRLGADVSTRCAEPCDRNGGNDDGTRRGLILFLDEAVESDWKAWQMVETRSYTGMVDESRGKLVGAGREGGDLR